MIQNLNSEINEYKKIYTDIIFALDEIKPFVDDKTLNKRKYIKIIADLKKYIKMLEDHQRKEKKRTFINKIFSSNENSLYQIEQFKAENTKKFNQLKDCSKCKCFNCTLDCKMESCNRCEPSGKVKSCDNKTNSVYVFKDKKIYLANDRTGETNLWSVLGIIQDLEYNQYYIIVELKDEKMVLYYYPGISEDEFGEISDIEDFNFAIECFENAQ